MKVEVLCFVGEEKSWWGVNEMPTRNVKLTDQLDQFVDDGISSGRFGNASEVVREGLRLLRQRELEDEAELNWLCGAAKAGFDSIDRGNGIGFDSVDDLAAYLREVGAQVATESEQKLG